MLYFMIGIPRSGKSTWAREYSKNNNLIHIEVDKIRLALGHRFNTEVEPHVESTKYTMTKTLLLSGYSVMLDDTHTTKSSIFNVLKIDINAIPIVYECDLEVCKQRAIETKQEDLVPVLEKFHKQYMELVNSNIYSVVEELKSKIYKKIVDPVF